MIFDIFFIESDFSALDCQLIVKNCKHVFMLQRDNQTDLRISFLYFYQMNRKIFKKVAAIIRYI